jgi:hypothetical protein
MKAALAWFLPGIVLLTGSLTFAAPPPPPYCAPLTFLLPEVPLCKGNPLFVNAADKCLAKLEAETKTIYSAGLASKMAGLDAASASGQRSKQENALGDLTGSIATLKALLVKARAGKFETGQYLKRLVWPAGMPETLVRRLGVADLLEEIPCYAQNQAALEARIATWEKKIQELETALDESNRLAARTQGNANRMSGSAPTPELAREKTGVPLKKPKGSTAPGDSKVTGNADRTQLPENQKSP